MNVFQRNAKYIVILAVILGSFSAIFAKLITAPPVAIGFYRLTFALPFFAIPILLKHRDVLRKISGKDYGLCLLGGGFLAGHFFSWFTAVQTTTIASAVVLAALHPIVVLITTILIFKTPVPVKAVLGIFVALIGGAIVAGFDYTFTDIHFFGDVMGLLAGIFMGLYFLMGNAVRKRIPAGTTVFLLFLGCWICFFIGMIVTGTSFTGYPAMDWVWLLAMTLSCQIGAHAVMNWSLGYVSPLYVSAWATADIVIATAFAFVIFGEVPGVWRTIGAVIVLGGLLYYNKHEGHPPKISGGD